MDETKNKFDFRVWNSDENTRIFRITDPTGARALASVVLGAINMEGERETLLDQAVRTFIQLLGADYFNKGYLKRPYWEVHSPQKNPPLSYCLPKITGGADYFWALSRDKRWTCNSTVWPLSISGACPHSGAQQRDFLWNHAFPRESKASSVFISRLEVAILQRVKINVICDFSLLFPAKWS